MGHVIRNFKNGFEPYFFVNTNLEKSLKKRAEETGFQGFGGFIPKKDSYAF